MSRQEQKPTAWLPLKIPIRVVMFEAATERFAEETHTLAVNSVGAHIALKHRLDAEDIIRIINLDSLSEADFRVVGPTRWDANEVAQWGVECTERGRNIWGVNLAPLNVRGPETVALECRACHKQGSWPVTPMEIEVLDSTGVVVRACNDCGQATYWAYAELARRPRQFSPSEPTVPPPRQTEIKKQERAYKRLAIKLPTWVRTPNGEEEITKTENVSKGGLAVYLAMDLKVGDRVTMASPYTPGAQNIEQEAEVRYRAAFPFGERRLYGLRYVR